MLCLGGIDARAIGLLDVGKIGGQTCQVYTPENGGKYLCPEGYFCMYTSEKDSLDANKTGECAAMEHPAVSVRKAGPIYAAGRGQRRG